MLLQRGSVGVDVGHLESRLFELRLYQGSIDNTFGEGVESAVKAFQRLNALPADGVVGDRTWARLFVTGNLNQRCLALTGSFETSTGPPGCYATLAGDFDGQGLSFGALQWNIGQGTLQPLLTEMISQHEKVAAVIFRQNFDGLRSILASSKEAQLTWARGISQPWRAMLKALGLTTEFQAIQVKHAASFYAAAVALCVRFGLTTERGTALMFDISVQNGSIHEVVEALIRADFALIPKDAMPMDAELARLRSIANRRAEASAAAYVEDVRARKLTIANGTGTVHGAVYDLERQFGIGLRCI